MKLLALIIALGAFVTATAPVIVYPIKLQWTQPVAKITSKSVQAWQACVFSYSNGKAIPGLQFCGTQKGTGAPVLTGVQFVTAKKVTWKPATMTYAQLQKDEVK